MIYPIPTYVSNCQKCPKLLAVNILYLNLFLKIYIFQPAAEGRTETSQLTFVPKSWHDISNTNIYLQLLKLSQTVGCEYLICTSSKMYISQPHARWLQRISPTYILLPRVWHYISHTNIDMYSLKSWLPISDTNLYFHHP